MGTEDKEPENKDVKVLDGTTPVQIRFIGWLLSICAGGFCIWIWWAATISSKLDALISQTATQALAVKAITDDVTRLKEWRIQVDTAGSPTMSKKVDELAREILDLQKQLDMHKATTTAKP
jgi:hypothetical protein